MSFKQQIQNKIDELQGNLILIHSDIRHGFEIPIRNEKDFFSSNIQEIQSLKTGMDIWMPSFNYDFCKGTPFNVNTTPSQVGGLTEYFRKFVAGWRTFIPVFSFAGTGTPPELDLSGIIDPFGTKSAFHLLHEKDALLLHYGSSFDTTTVLHYVERISNRLCYRYDKLFSGTVKCLPDMEAKVTINYHVRPLNRHLDYHWDKIVKDLLEKNILFVFSEGRSRISLCKISALTDFWLEKIAQDPLYLLDHESRMWIEPFLDKLGRPFLISDFEKPELQ